MIEPPFAVRGESSRQNGPSRFAVVSVAPLLPLLSRQTRVETPSEPDISTASLWKALEFWPIALTMAQRLVEFLLGQLHLADEGVQVACTSAVITSRKRGSGARAISASTAWRDLIRTLDDHGFLPAASPLYSLAELICLRARLLNPPGSTLPRDLP